jgi:hypothetical protein
MPHNKDCFDAIARSLVQADVRREPFSHWLLSDVLPRDLASALCALPVGPPIEGDSLGRRETHNSRRVFLAPRLQAGHGCARTLAGVLQDPHMVGLLEARTGARLSDHSLRIEYCQDSEGFWLEPHTDIGAKAFTMLVYLSDVPQAADWGTDIYDAAHRHAGRAPGEYNRGLIFVPGTDTWHGVEKRHFGGIRRSLIINYVVPDWRARHELAFPDTPVQALSL